MKVPSLTSSFISDSNNYNQSRLKMKNSLLISMTIYFKTAFGLGLLSAQMYFFLTGWALGVLVTCITGGIIIYGMTLINDLSYDIEQSNKGVELEQFEEIANYVYQSRFWRIFMYIGKWFFFFCPNLWNLEFFLSEFRKSFPKKF